MSEIESPESGQTGESVDEKPASVEGEDAPAEEQDKGTPGFGSILAISGLLVAVYLSERRN
ncbi:PGF-CTERM sorting domain-containing protein [Methanococcoides burtonii]|uniref:PGF-CTERM sorting domain-containing protein n=1 Tax=Methanococcoides burtonii TaxID=29291 RepID=UPI00003993A3|nr:PGF-CTERM sorting domain-containing protein [Methanococcoides burtonii]